MHRTDARPEDQAKKKTEKKAALETSRQRHDTCMEQRECSQKAADEWNDFW